MTRMQASSQNLTSIAKPIVAVLLTLSAALASPSAVRAQFEPISTPAMPGQGFWVEVIYATPQWLVVQNAIGQQFPLSIQAADRGFMIRQPIALQDVPLGAIAEVLGLEGDNGGVITDHIDFYEGALAQNATPTSQLILGNGQPTDELSISYQLANGFLFPILGDDGTLPTRRQVVAPVINLQPLQLARAGNRAHTVLGGPQGLLLTRLAFQQGSFAGVVPGDLVFMVPSSVAPYTARTINPSQMVIYRGFR